MKLSDIVSFSLILCAGIVLGGYFMLIYITNKIDKDKSLAFKVDNRTPILCIKAIEVQNVQ